MYRQPVHQPMHAGAPWGQPPQQQQQPYFPSGDHGQPPPHWQPQQPIPVYPDHAPPGQFQHPPGHHGRGQGDELSQRLKEEQRRKQNEYSQALSEQVRQREAQKQHEREARRREDGDGGTNGHAIDPATGQPKVERGLFDGLGQTNNNQRGNYGRGRREAPQQPQHQPPALHQSPTQPQLHQVPPVAMENPMQQAWSGYSEALGIAEFPQHHYGDPQIGFTPRQADAEAYNPPPPQYQQPPPQQLQLQQPPGGAGRRVRNDLHNAGAGGIVDDAQARRRQQQQLDMQDSLRRQIEDKQRLKQEEKRKREEEERREMERFEQEKRRQHEEQERIKEEKRRKALAEEEHFRAQQQQLEAANAAAAHEKEQRHLRDQRNRQSPNKAAHNGDLHHGNVAQPPQQQPQHVPSLQKNPFTNSRAHLFQDPPVAEPSVALMNPIVTRQPQGFHHASPHRQFGQQPPHHQAPGVPQYNQATPPLVDAQALMEQYEQVREELQRQRELVEHLHAQIQQQQQQQQHRHPREDPRELPTLSDLERLRQELRDELEQRETQHRHELASLRKQTQQDHRQQFAKVSPPKQTIQHEPDYQRPRQFPTNPGPRRRHDAFVQDALDDEDDFHQDLRESKLSNQGSRESPVAPRRNAMSPPEPHRSSKLLGSSLSASSLQCESKLVFFDGRVQPAAAHPRSRSPELIAEEPEQVESDDEEERMDEDDSVDDLLLQFRQSFPREKSHLHKMKPSSNQDDTEPRRSLNNPTALVKSADENDDDALGFFVKRLEVSPAEPDRYRVSTDGYQNESRPLRQAPVDSPTLDNIDDLEYRDEVDEDEDDGSLNGEKLEAIFQRNVRRHEILSGFEASTQHRAPEPMHWEQLQQLLRNVPRDLEKASGVANGNGAKEESLVASSRWMPSSLLH